MRKLWLFVVPFIILYFLVRIPLFQTGWDGSDANGHHTDIFLHQLSGPNYLLLSDISGHKNYDAPSHPAPMYQALSYLGGFISQFTDLQNLPYGEIVFRIKLISAAIQLGMFLLFACLVFKSDLSPKKITLAIALLFVFSMTPLAINNTNELQMDSFFGAPMTGLYTWVLGAAFLGLLSGWQLSLSLMVTSFLVGLGKNEWTVLLLSSLVVGAAYLAYQRYFSDDQHPTQSDWLTVASPILGCFLGNLVSYNCDSINYIGGWQLMTRMSGSASILAPDGIAHFIYYTMQRMPFIFAPLILWGYASWMMLRMKLRSTPIVLGYLFASALLFGFLFSTWGGVIPRYFAPAYAALLATCMAIFVRYQELKLNWPVRIFIALVITVAQQSVVYLLSPNLVYTHQTGIRHINMTISNNSCVYLLPIEDTFGKNIDYVVLGMGYEAAEKIAAGYGKHICQTIP